MCLDNLVDLELCKRHEKTILRENGHAYIDAELRAQLAPADFFADTTPIGELQCLS